MEFSERLIFKGLVLYEDYFSKIYPILNESLFIDITSKYLFKATKKYYVAYSSRPTVSALQLAADKSNFTAEQLTDATNLLEYIQYPEEIDVNWLITETVKWVRLRKTYDSLAEAAEKLQRGEVDTSLVDKLNDIASITTELEIGTDISNVEERWNLYHAIEEHMPFRISILNEITNGGIMKGTLTCFMSNKTGGGKSAIMCSLATDFIRNGINTLYISLEMSEKSVMERIDANILDIEINDIASLSKTEFMNRYEKFSSSFSNLGRFIVKQFPTSAAHVGHIRRLLKDLKIKKDFIPEVIFIDYINIMASSRNQDREKDYVMKKLISEELRGLAVEYNVAVFTGIQSNRGGYDAAEELDMNDVAEAFGTTFVMDMMLGVINTPQLQQEKKIMFKQFKNRYKDVNNPSAFVLGMDFSKMKLFDISGPNSEEKEDEEINTLFTKSKGVGVFGARK